MYMSEQQGKFNFFSLNGTGLAFDYSSIIDLSTALADLIILV